MGCSITTPSFCDCNNDGSSPFLKDTIDFCFTNKQCCYTIADNYNSLGYTFKDFSCRIVNDTMTQLFPETCTPPCSKFHLKGCDCQKDSKSDFLKDTIQYCLDTADKGCCTPIREKFETLGYSHTDYGCSIVNNTMTQLYPQVCKLPCSPFYPDNCEPESTPLNWRDPITSGRKCFTTSIENSTNQVIYKNQANSLGNGFICINYLSWYEPLQNYVGVATSGDINLYQSLAAYPDMYMNLTWCDTDYCNDPAKLQRFIRSFQPELSLQSGPGLDCFKGIHPNVVSQFIYQAEVCVRYSFKPNFNSPLVTVYDGLPANILPRLQNTLYIQNVFSCSTSNCNTVINPASETSLIVSPNSSGNLFCFETIDSADTGVMHPSPFSEPSSKYCVKLKSSVDNTTLFFAAGNYTSFSSYSRASDVQVCNTDFCNAPQSSTRSLKCYLTNPRNISTIVQYTGSIPIDYCVRYKISSGNVIFSGVTADQLQLITSMSTKFSELQSCQEDYCIPPT